MILYLEINKSTGAIENGVWTADVLPTFADDYPYVAKEVKAHPTDWYQQTFGNHIIEGQTFTQSTGTINDTQTSLNIKNRQYLNHTDWYVLRATEGGTAVPSDITTKRAAARAAIKDSDV